MGRRLARSGLRSGRPRHLDDVRQLADLQTAVSKLQSGAAVEADERPVVAAVVTSAQGVLVGKRNDGKPPWTFIAGEIEPGEWPEDPRCAR
jgi:hypothetical protein